MAVVTATICQARTIYINSNGTGDYPVIQAAVVDTDDGDVVILQPGTYAGPGNRDINLLGKAITVRSNDPNDSSVVSATIIDCQGTAREPHRGFYLSSGEDSNSVLAGLKITNGYGPEMYGGGGIVCLSSSPTISNCIFQGNIATGGMLGYGGGISCWSSYAAIKNCTFVENNAIRGGGISIDGGRPTIANCTFRRNTSWYGGGVDIGDTNGLALLTDSMFSSNSVVYRGGGAFLQRADLKMTNCIFSGNSADFDGGAVCNTSSSNWNGEVFVDNCTITGNRTGGMCGGIINLLTSGSATITNCILWGNSDDGGIDESAQVYNNNFSTHINYCSVQGWTGGLGGVGNIDADPCFVVSGYWDPNGTPENINDDFWVDGDYHLQIDSPCIDSGDPNYAAGPNETDLDGESRISGQRVDMGAYEYQFNTLPVASAGPNQVAYAWIDGIADVTLDANGSYDADGDELTYLWRWTIDGNTYEANGVSPTIELPVGEHKIELVVNDGRENSEPNQVVITVVEPIEGTLWVTPWIINGQCEQPRIITMLKLPAGISRRQVNERQKLLLYPGEIKANYQLILPCYERGVERAVIFAFFDKQSLMDAVGRNGLVWLDVVGQLKTGQYFYGRDKVFVINPPKRKPNWCLPGWFDNCDRR
jgi:hypothetical protein